MSGLKAMKGLLAMQGLLGSARDCRWPSDAPVRSVTLDDVPVHM